MIAHPGYWQDNGSGDERNHLLREVSRLTRELEQARSAHESAVAYGEVRDEDVKDLKRQLEQARRENAEIRKQWRETTSGEVAGLREDLEQARRERDEAKQPLWECDGCGFAFSRQHSNADGSYTCPICNDATNGLALAAWREVGEAASLVGGEHNAACEAGADTKTCIACNALSRLTAALAKAREVDQ